MNRIWFRGWGWLYQPVSIIAIGMMTIACLAPAAHAAAPPPASTNALHADPAQPDVSGLWVITGAFNFAPDKAPPKLLGEYKALYDKRTAAIKAGIAIDDVTADCLPAGMPHLLVVPYPFEIMQTPGRVTFLYEYDSVVRRVPLAGADKLKWNEDAVSYHGDSSGHWEGDTLVIDTINIRAIHSSTSRGPTATSCASRSTGAAASTTLENRITRRIQAYAEPSRSRTSTGCARSGRSRVRLERTTATRPMPRAAPAVGCQSHESRVCVVSCVLVTAVAPTARAHHSGAMYDNARQVTIEGVVKDFQWTNPHVWIQVLVPNDKGGSDEWGVECTSVNFMERRGWTRRTLKAGDRISVTLSPLRDGSRGGSFRSVNNLNGAPLVLQAEE
jgi:hypothetical protein